MSQNTFYCPVDKSKTMSEDVAHHGVVIKTEMSSQQ